MLKTTCLLALLLSTSLFGLVKPTNAEDIDHIRLRSREAKDSRWVYPAELLNAAMARTEKDFGPWEISASGPIMSRNRTLLALQEGRLINVHSTATRTEWEEQAIPIRIPIRKGLLGYRLLLIHGQNQELFAKFEKLDELRKLSAGSHYQWSITKVLRNLDFTVVEGTSYVGLFSMLHAQRFDYFPRGVNEIFEELETHQGKLPNLMVEPTKAIYLPLPTYFFVSPKYPRLAKRIQVGLERMLEDGSFDQTFEAHHAEHIRQARLAERQIFIVSNPLLPAMTPLGNKRLWLNIEQLKKTSTQAN